MSGDETAGLEGPRPGTRAQAAQGLVTPPSAPSAPSGGPAADWPSVVEGWLPAQGAKIGAYELLDQIGSGGFGEVWRAVRTEPFKQMVALKLIKPGMDSRAFLERFESERQLLALMDHPSIARVTDAGMTPAGRPYFTMELVRGGPLSRRSGPDRPGYCDEKRMTITQRLELFCDICRAVQHAHQKGVVHRDLKPSNILITEVDSKPVPKIIDFGIAKATAPGGPGAGAYTAAHELLGTPEYMSPEQLDPTGLDVDTRADVFALGMVLSYMLTGVRPYSPIELRSMAVDEICATIRDRVPPLVSSRFTEDAEDAAERAELRQSEPAAVRKRLKGDLDWIVRKATDKDRNRRYDTATALADDVQRHLRLMPVRARPPKVSDQVSKFARRNRGALIWAGAAATGVLVSVTGVSVMLATQEARLRNEQLREQNAELIRLSAGGLLDQSLISRGGFVELPEGLGDRLARRDELSKGSQSLLAYELRRSAADRYGRGDAGDAGVLMEEAMWWAGTALAGKEVASMAWRKDYAIMLDEGGEPDGAAEMFEQNLESARRVHGETARETVQARELLAEMLPKVSPERAVAARAAIEARAGERRVVEPVVEAEALATLSWDALQRGRTEAADRFVQRAMSVEGVDRATITWVNARRLAASIALELGRTDDALELAHEALRQARVTDEVRYDELPRYMVVAAQAELSAGDVDAARALAIESIDWLEARDRVRRALATIRTLETIELLVRTGEREAAKAAAERLFAELPRGPIETDAGAANALAYALLTVGIEELRDPEQARVLATRAVLMWTGQDYEDAARETLALAYYQLGRYRDGLREADRAADLRPEILKVAKTRAAIQAALAGREHEDPAPLPQSAIR